MCVVTLKLFPKVLWRPALSFRAVQCLGGHWPFDTVFCTVLTHLYIALLFHSLPGVNCFQYINFFSSFHNLGIILTANDIIGMAVYI